jgi:SPP1 family predicted phage head-tail adaptor
MLIMPGNGAGELRQRVLFARPNIIEDAYGNVSTGWEEMFTVSANITPRLGGETVEAARLTGRQPVVIRVRQSDHTRQIRTDWRATNTHNGVAYNIRTAVDPHEGNTEHGKWIDMLAEAGVAI